MGAASVVVNCGALRSTSNPNLNISKGLKQLILVPWSGSTDVS